MSTSSARGDSAARSGGERSSARPSSAHSALDSTRGVANAQEAAPLAAGGERPLMSRIGNRGMRTLLQPLLPAAPRVPATHASAPRTLLANALEESGTPLDASLRERMQRSFSGSALAGRAAGVTSRSDLRRGRIDMDAHDSAAESQAERHAAGASRTVVSAETSDKVSTNTASETPSAADALPDFSRVRIHAGTRGAQAAGAMRARALAVGEHIVFGDGQYAPHSEAGRALLAHELTHVLQHRGLSTPRVSRSPLPGAEAADPLLATIETRDFRTLWTAFERARWASREEEARALVPALIARMSGEDARSHAAELAFWLIDRGERAQALQALSALETAWWVGYAAGDLPIAVFGGFGMPAGPEMLVERGESEASAGQHDTAYALLGIAHLMVQMSLDRLYRQAAADRERAADLGPGGAYLATFGAMLREGDLNRLTQLRTRILNVYPALVAASRDAGDAATQATRSEAATRLGDALTSRFTLAEMADASDLSTPLGPASPPPRARGSSGSAASATPSAPESSSAPVATPEGDVAAAGVVAETTVPRAVAGAETDRVVNAPPPFEGGTALALPGNHYVAVRSERYAVSESLARAVSWAQNLFGVNSSVVVLHLDDDGVARYYAASLDEDISDSVPAADPMRAVAVPLSVPLMALPNHYDIMVIHVGNGVGLWPTPERKAGFDRALAMQQASSPGVATLDREHVRREVFSTIDALMADEEENREEIARRLAQLDATAFATLTGEQRTAYLEVLLRAWTYQAQERAVVEIMRSVPSVTELQAIIARLREADLWESLIDDLDLELWSLLTTVGQRFGGDALTLGNLYQFMADAGLLNIGTPIPGLSIGPNGPVFDADVIAEIEEAANSFIRFLEGMWDAIVMLITRPDRVVEGLAQLTKMILVFKLAEYGYVPAMVMRQQIVENIGRQLLNGFKGVVVLGVGEEVLRRIKWALIWEVASMFVGIGEIRAAMGAMEVSSRVGAIARFLRILGLAGRAAEGERAVGGLTRLAGILGRSSRLLRTEEEVLVALSHLPDDEAARLGRALEGIELGEGLTLDALRAAHPELAEVATTSLQRAETLHRLAAKMGGFSDEVARLFARLSRGGHSGDELARIVGLIPEGEGERFARVIGMMDDDAALSGARGLSNLELLAASTTRMQAVERYGYRAIDSLMAYAEHEAADLDGLITALGRVEGELPEVGRADQFSHFVEAVADSDPEALAWLDRRVPGAHPTAPRPRPTTTAHDASIRELVEDYGLYYTDDEMARITADMRSSLVGKTDDEAMAMFDAWEEQMRQRVPAAVAPSATVSVADYEARIQRLLDRMERHGMSASPDEAAAAIRQRLEGRTPEEADAILRDLERSVDVREDAAASALPRTRGGDPETPTQPLPIGPREPAGGPVVDEPPPGPVTSRPLDTPIAPARPASGGARVEVGPDDIAAMRARYPNLHPDRDTVAVARTDVPGMEAELFEGGSPAVRRDAMRGDRPGRAPGGGRDPEPGLPEPELGPVESPSPSAQFRQHAEEDLANRFIARVREFGLTEAQLEGRTLAIHISNTYVCHACRGGISARFWSTSGTVESGVLRQLSERYPGLIIRVTTEAPATAPAAQRGFVLLGGVAI